LTLCPKSTSRYRIPPAAWQLVAATPAILGSFFLLVMAFGWMGSWELLVLGGWLLIGIAICSRRGERFAINRTRRYLSPNPAQRSLLDPAWSAATARCGVNPADFDLWIQSGQDINACAAGRRTIAVTVGLLEELMAGRVTEADLVAVLVHEFGHHATRATRFSLMSWWLAAPWRRTAWFTLGLMTAFGGRRQPPWLSVLLATLVLASAAAHTAS
jgi:STE24 endopeptidase